MQHVAIPNQDISRLSFSESIAIFDEMLGELRNTVLQIPPFKDPTEWIEENIELPKGKTSRPGKLKLTGYQRYAASLFMDPEVSQITILKGAQVGYSVFLAAMISYGLAYLGIPVAVAQPTDDDAKSYFKDRIEPLLREVAALAKNRRNPARGEVQDTWNEHHFINGAVLRLVGAVSDDSFRRYTARWMIGDEYSAKGWAKSKGSQGEKAELFRTRGTDFIDSLLVLGSTPLSRDDCRTYHDYMKSDRSEPEVACPHCGLAQVLKWGDKETPYGFKFTRDADGYVTDCWYQCEGDDGCRIDEVHKTDMVDAVDYVPRHRPKRPGHRGVQWPQWLSDAPGAAWRILAQGFVNSKNDPEARKVWLNNVAGTVWDDFTTSALDEDSIARIAVNYPAQVPDDVVLLTAGIDTQTNKEGNELETLASREATVVGWTRNGQFRIIGHWIIEGAPGEAAADQKLTDLLNRKFTRRDGTEVGIAAAAIDLGGHFADEVRAYTARFSAKRSVWAIKGRNNTKGTRSATVWPKKASKSTKGGASFYVIDSQLSKDAVFRLIQLKDDASPLVPMSMPPDYLKKLMCEERRRVNGGWYWQPKRGGRAEEEWACLAYAYAALKGLQATWRDYRDLNLTGHRLGIPELSFDPETGELGYDGEDFSVHAVERKAAKVQLDQADVPVPTLALVAKKERKPRKETSHPESVTVPTPPEGAQKRKRKPTWTSGTVRRW